VIDFFATAFGFAVLGTLVGVVGTAALFWLSSLGGDE
jgi:hypothetical protein